MTIKQQIAIEKLVGNGGNVTQAMIEAGYSPATANTPSKLTTSKGWKELMEQYLPDGKLLEKHDEALNANKVVSARITGKDADSMTDDFIEVPDHQVRLKAVELAYKIKGRVVDKGINIENKVLVIPAELIDKYDIASDTKDGSQGQS